MEYKEKILPSAAYQAIVATEPSGRKKLLGTQICWL